MYEDEGTRGGLEELRLLVVAMVGREQGGCASSSGGGTVDDKVGKDTRDARESSPQSGRKLRGGKVTGRRDTGRKETGRKGTGGKTTGVKERGVGETGGKEKGVGETGGKTTGVKERGTGETGGKEKGVGETGGKTTGVKERGVGETGGKEKGVGETGGKTTGVKERGLGETRAKEWEVGETGEKETGGKGSGQNVMEGIERKSYSAAVIEGVRKRARVFVGDSIVRKTDRVLNKGDDVVVCLPGAKIEAITLVHVGTNNIEREGTTAIVRKYRQLVRTLKQTRVEQVILSGILPVIGRRGHRYRNCRGMAINMLVEKLCREEDVGFVDLWGRIVGRADMYMKDGLHLSGKGAAVFADKLSAAVDSDLGTITNIFGSKHSLN